jgi:uncharacterized protein
VSRRTATFRRFQTPAHPSNAGSQSDTRVGVRNIRPSDGQPQTRLCFTKRVQRAATWQFLGDDGECTIAIHPRIASRNNNRSCGTRTIVVEPSTLHQTSRSWKQIKVRWVLLKVISSLWRIYLMLILVAMLGQRRMMYPAPKSAIVPKAPGLQLLTIPGRDGRQVHAFYLPARSDALTMVIFHGNGEQIADTVPLAQDFSDYGLGTLAIEYPGYALSSAYTTTEQNVYADAEQAIFHLQRALGVPRERVVLMGQSLGAAVAAEMASRGLAARLVLLSPFTSMTDMVSKIAPIIPTRLLLEDRYDTLSKGSRLTLPTLLIHGTSDAVVPVSMGKTLAGKIAGVTLLLVPGADHNNVYDVGGPSLLRRIALFANHGK